MRVALNREAGAKPALSRSCNAESTPIWHWETGKAEKTRKQSQKNCPIGTLYRSCERQEGAMFVLYAFLPESKKAFCFDVGETEYAKEDFDLWTIGSCAYLRSL